MKHNQEVSGAVRFAHDVRVVRGGDFTKRLHRLWQEGEGGTIIDSQEGADDLERDVS